MLSTTASEVSELKHNDTNKIAAMFRAEELRADSGYYEAYTIRPYNPDIIVQKKGDFSTYDRMRRDDQIKAVLWLKKFMVLSTGWDIVPFKDKEDEQEEVVNFLKKVLTDLDEPDFGDALINILTHIDYGFSITEPVFRVNRENKIVLSKLKTRAPHTFLFNTDKFGTIESVTQYTGEADVEFDIKKMLYLTHQADFGNPYGTSDLQAAYRPWFSKDMNIRFWNIYNERFGNPHVIATMPANRKKQDKIDMLDILKTLQARTGITIPEGWDLKLLFPPAGGNVGLENSIDKNNMMIARSMLVPDLIGIGGKETGGGAFALGEKHFEMFFITINKMKMDLKRLSNRKLIQPLCLWNFGMTENYPEWGLNETTDSDKNELLKLWVDATKGKVWRPTDEEINHFRKQTNFPQSEVVDRVEEGQSNASSFKSKLDTSINLDKDITDTKLSTEKNQMSFKTYKEDDCDQTLYTWNDSNNSGAEINKFVKLSREKTIYEEKVNFGRIDNDLNSLNDEAYKTFVPIFMKIKGSTIASVERSKVVEKQKVGSIDNLTLKHLKELQVAWKRILRDVYDSGADSADREISKFNVLAKGLPGLFEDTIESRSFHITGIHDDEITKKVKSIILAGMDKGDTTEDIVFKLEEYFDGDYGWITQPKAGVKINPAERLETIVRTNTIKAYNFGRRKQFESPLLKDFVQGYQFSAILDARTSAVCNTLDGKTYKMTDSDLNRITPPVHFRCRSLLIPITIDEPFKQDKANLEDIKKKTPGAFV